MTTRKETERRARRHWRNSVGVSSSELTTEQENEWARFYTGTWVREMPTTPGNYPIVCSNGDPGGEVTVVVGEDIGPFTAQYAPIGFVGSSWGGYFWSEPLPAGLLLPPFEVEGNEGKED